MAAGETAGPENGRGRTKEHAVIKEPLTASLTAPAKVIHEAKEEYGLDSNGRGLLSTGIPVGYRGSIPRSRRPGQSSRARAFASVKTEAHNCWPTSNSPDTVAVASKINAGTFVDTEGFNWLRPTNSSREDASRQDCPDGPAFPAVHVL